MSSIQGFHSRTRAYRFQVRAPEKGHEIGRSFTLPRLSDMETAPTPENVSGPRLDGVTFEVFVQHMQPEIVGRFHFKQWLVRVHAAGEHIHSAEGDVGDGLRKASATTEQWCRENGA